MYNKEYYPTPEHLTDKMASKVDWERVNCMLEPSAGTGNIADAFKDRYRRFLHQTWRSDVSFDLDCVEIEPDFRSVLKGKEYRVVGDDFLAFSTYKRYDLIAMNPPFSNGDEHLLKAIELMSYGGQIVCVLNAETIRNTYTRNRQLLKRKLEELNADIEYLTDQFTNAERKTDVEIALVYIDIPCNEESEILANLKKGWVRRSEPEVSEYGEIAKSDIYAALVDQYNFELAAGVKLIDEFRALAPKMLRDPGEGQYNTPIFKLEVNIGSSTYKNADVNLFVRQVRRKYWTAIMQTDKINRLMTKQMRDDYMSKLADMCDYDVTMSNIYQLFIDLTAQINSSLDDAILELFEKFTYRFSADTEGNIHLFNGWKTNKAWIINKKVIVPWMDCWSDIWHKFQYRYSVLERLMEVEKVFNYLNPGDVTGIDLAYALEKAEQMQESKKIHCKYFDVTFYKKGTCHIEFTNEELLKRFNLYGCQRKGWLPPSYGKKAYSDMSTEEQAVIDEIGGEKEYKEVLKNKDFYLSPISNTLMLTA